MRKNHMQENYMSGLDLSLKKLLLFTSSTYYKCLSGEHVIIRYMNAAVGKRTVGVRRGFVKYNLQEKSPSPKVGIKLNTGK